MVVDFSKNLIKEYRHWEVYIHENQNYLGRCVVWCRRENALDLADATKEEQEELFLILRDLREALKKSFQPDWLITLNHKIGFCCKVLCSATNLQLLVGLSVYADKPPRIYKFSPKT